MTTLSSQLKQVMTEVRALRLALYDQDGDLHFDAVFMKHDLQRAEKALQEEDAIRISVCLERLQQYVEGAKEFYPHLLKANAEIDA